MNVLDLKKLVIENNINNGNEEIYRFMIEQIHYDFSLFQRLFGSYFLSNPDFFQIPEMQKMAMLLNSMSSAVSKLPDLVISSDMYFRFFQEHKDPEVVQSYFQTQYADLSKYFREHFEKYIQYAKNDFYYEVGAVLYFFISSSFNIFLAPYYVKICHMIHRDFPGRNEFLLALANVKDPNVLKCIYNCLVLSKDEYIASDVYDIDPMPSFLKNQFSLFYKVIVDMTKSLNSASDYEWLTQMFQELLRTKKSLSIQNYQDLLLFLQMESSNLKYILERIDDYTSLYLSMDQFSKLGNVNHSVENTVDFLNLEHYKRNRSFE